MTLARLALVLLAIAVAVVSRRDADVPEPRVFVVVANEAIPTDTWITADMLKVEYLSPGQNPAFFFTSHSQMVGLVATEDIAAGATIVPSMVSDHGGIQLFHEYPPGQAVSIEVERVSLVGLRPGDRVDAVAIFEVPSAEAAADILQILGPDYIDVLPEPPRLAEAADDGHFVLTVPMLWGVELLAMERNLTPSTAMATLELRARDAERIVRADHFGTLRLERGDIGSTWR